MPISAPPSVDLPLPQATKPDGRTRSRSAAKPADMPQPLPALSPLVMLLARLVAADLMAEGTEVTSQ